MKKNKLSPWIFLGLLFGLAMLGLGIKQGMKVGENNALSKISFEAKMLKLTPSHAPPPTPIVEYKNISDVKCSVAYLLPETVSSAEAKIDLICEKKTASQTAELKRDGYEMIKLPNNKELLLKSMDEYFELVKRTLEPIEKE